MIDDVARESVVLLCVRLRLVLSWICKFTPKEEEGKMCSSKD